MQAPGMSGGLVEVQRGRVHAVTFAGRGRAVIKDMAEMSPAPGAEHFIPHHPTGGIGMGPDIEGGYRGKETGPAGAGVKLGIRQKEVGTAADAGINAVFLESMVFSGKCIFRPLFSVPPEIVPGSAALSTLHRFLPRGRGLLSYRSGHCKSGSAILVFPGAILLSSRRDSPAGT